MQTVTWKYNQPIPVLHEADVIVAGGGPGGIGAAVMAARAGAKTLLIERFGCLGGMATVGEVHPFMSNHVDGKSLDGPVYGEWVAKMQAYVPADAPERFISKEAAMLGSEELVLEAGAKILYHHTLADAIVAGGKVQAVVLQSKSGFTAARAQIYIDCTGDADLATRAGCEFEQGGPSGHCQPMTLCFKLSHVDRAAMPERAEINRLYDAAKARGEINCPRENILAFSWYDDDVVHFNTTRVIHKNGVNGSELSEAEIEARQQVREIYRFLTTSVRGFEQARFHSIAHHIGIRETRRVLGRNYITRSDFEQAAKQPDAIARCRYCIDIHNPDGSGTEITRLPDGDWYEIPYGCIVARDLDNLLIGGRPISVDHALHSSMRIMPPACSVGQAAGLAAAMAVQQGCDPAELDGKAVRQQLVERGAPLR